jgi:adenylate kinase
MVARRIEEHDWNFGFILDGFPRSPAQAEFFTERWDIDAVIVLEVPDEDVVKRILARRLCSQCGLDYNLLSHRPQREAVCDECGGALIQRADDNDKAVRARLHDYHAQTEPVIDLLGRKERILRVDGRKPPEEVHAEIRGRLGLSSPAAT